MNVVASGRHQNQIDTGRDQYHRVKHYATRDENLDIPLPVTRGRDCDHRHRQCVHHTARRHQHHVDTIEQHRVGVQVEIVGEHQAHAEAQMFERPARVAGGVAKHLLDQHQHAERHQQRDTEHRFAYQGMIELDAKHSAIEQFRQQYPGDAGADGQERAELDGVAVGGVAEIEQQPGKERDPHQVAYEFKLQEQIGGQSAARRELKVDRLGGEPQGRRGGGRHQQPAYRLVPCRHH